jgi:hypothetical protein
MSKSFAGRTLEAGEFILRDGNGKVRARLAAPPGGARLDLYDDGGTTRASLGITAAGVGLAFYDPDGKPQATLGSGLSAVAARQPGPRGEPEGFYGQAEDAPILIFYGRNRTPQIMLSMVRGRPQIRLFDEKGKVIQSAPQE